MKISELIKELEKFNNAEDVYVDHDNELFFYGKAEDLLNELKTLMENKGCDGKARLKDKPLSRVGYIRVETSDGLYSSKIVLH